jgi:2-polyprenyl-3-methyl-5-hydroxy-6-metoxy-1,4-benzoquinol methylase
MKRPTSATVVLPLYDAGLPVERFARDLAIAAYALRSRSIDLDVVTLDGAPDGSVDRMEATAHELGLQVDVLAGPPSGAAEAYLEGFRHVLQKSDADLIITLDANGRHDPTQLPHLVDRLVQGPFDVVIGSRWTRGSGTPGLSLRRWILGRLANVAFRSLTGTRGIADATTTFRVARREVVQDFRFRGAPLTGHNLQTAFVATAVARGYRVTETPIIYRSSSVAGGGLHAKDVGGFAAHLVRLRREVAPTRRDRLSAAGRSFTHDFFGARQDLERLGSAHHFFNWVLDEIEPYIGSRILEVGAGIGTITRKLIQRHPSTSVVALEPADNMFDDLTAVAALEPRIEVHRGTLAQYRDIGSGSFDAILYLNVLEHIERDAEEIKVAAEELRPGGALLIFGPALEWMYSELDYAAGHYRRYSVHGLSELVQKEGLSIESVRYMDILGVVPYALVYKVLRRTEISGSTMWAYDKLVVPISRLIQGALRRPPLGKNILLIATKP